MGLSGLSQSQPLCTPSSSRTEVQNSCVYHCGWFAALLLGSQTATPCTSGSRRKCSITRKPCEPTPMNAVLILSLGATYPGPPNTRRGTIENAAAAAVRPKNCRRETCPPKLRDNRSGFCIFPPRAHKLLRGIQCGNAARYNFTPLISLNVQSRRTPWDSFGDPD